MDFVSVGPIFGADSHYYDRRTLYRTLDDVHARRKITCIIEGEMSGAIYWLGNGLRIAA
jgi:hypothetical protein